MAARKSNRKAKPSTVKKATSSRKPKATKPKASVKAKADKGRSPSGAHHYYLNNLLSRVDTDEFDGYAVPETAEEANIQIRTMAAVSPKASLNQSRSKIVALMAAKPGTVKGTAKPPISDRKILAKLAKS